MEDAWGCLYPLVGIGVFLAVWVYCAATWGGLGFMLGWMPALVLAFIWPLLLVLAVLGALVVFALYLVAR